MISKATMTKRIDGTAVLTDRTPDLFTRNDTRGRFRGFASFDGGACVLLEVADTPASRAHGLMGRTSLPACCGMLFVGLDGGAFWMKNCKIPLDIVFLDGEGTVTRKYSMPADNGAKRYRYGDETVAIELPFGFCSRHGVKAGTLCDWRTW